MHTLKITVVLPRTQVAIPARVHYDLDPRGNVVITAVHAAETPEGAVTDITGLLRSAPIQGEYVRNALDALAVDVHMITAYEQAA